MANYRLYCLDGAGLISMAEWIEADGDDDAVAQARSLKRNGQKCEVWKKTRLIATLGPDDLADRPPPTASDLRREGALRRPRSANSSCDPAAYAPSGGST
jgi:hypothetical protein